MTDPTPDIPLEMLITRVLNERFEKEDVLRVSGRESVAYRIAEIMLAAKSLYTETLPRLTRENPDAEPLPLYDELAGLRMSFLHLRDLMHDFDEAFFEAMHYQREEEGVAPLLPPEDPEESEGPEYEEEDEE